MTPETPIPLLDQWLLDDEVGITLRAVAERYVGADEFEDWLGEFFRRQLRAWFNERIEEAESEYKPFDIAMAAQITTYVRIRDTLCGTGEGTG